MTGPHVVCEQVIPTLAVGDVAAAIDWYTEELGFEEAWRWGEPPRHASVKLGDVDLHLSATNPDPGSNWLYFVIEGVDMLYERLHERGVEVVHPPQDQEWGMREIQFRDPTGNHLTFAEPKILTKPELEIEREEVSVRLEARLVHVLRELAHHKRMGLTELFEETFLHTFVPMPGGSVASPHTATELKRIADLKEAHGMDYDVHASYRFRERGAPGPDEEE